MVDLLNGDLVWSKNNLAPFNSQIKIYKDKFFIVDFSNTLRCFSLKNGNELWNIQTENSLIRSKKKLSIVIKFCNISNVHFFVFKVKSAFLGSFNFPSTVMLFLFLYSLTKFVCFNVSTLTLHLVV